MLDRTDYVGTIAAGRDALVAGAERAGPDAAIPSCHAWTVRDLVVHAGNVHDWASSVLRTRVEQPQEFDLPPSGVGAGIGALTSWYAGRADALLDLLASSDVADAESCWTFGPPGTAAFWPRRQAHEITMHALDAALAGGVPVAAALAAVGPEMAADGVDEVLTVMMPRVAMFVPWRPLPGAVEVAATDAGRTWTIAPDGQVVSAPTGSEVRATLAGPAAAVFTLLWKRAVLPADGAALGAQVEGDGSVVEALLAARLTP